MLAAAFCLWILAAAPHLAAAPAEDAEEAEAAPAANDKLKSLRSWFSHWKKALEKSAVERRYSRSVRSTAVAAVRGSKQEEAHPDLPYWKGSWSEKKAAERMKEREELSAAVALILEEKVGPAEEALAAFEKAHPKSTLLADLKQARGKIDELKRELNPAPPPEPAAGEPAPPPETKAPAASPETEAAPEATPEPETGEAPSTEPDAEQ